MGRPRELTRQEREKLLADGYRPFEVWLPDFGDPQVLGRAEEEARRIAFADGEEDVLEWIEAVQKDMWEGEDKL